NIQRNNSNTSLSNLSTSLIDDGLLKTVENLGYNKDYLQKCILNNQLNYGTATYYLISKYNNMDMNI
ncbi:MAG: hypothetical protein MJ252_19030, partial [archaeon]|nr:hypothetical protein [archaeon]